MSSRSARTIVEDDDSTEPKATGEATGLGPESAGQSGDNQGLDDAEVSNSESVNELIEEGQYYEASVVSGIENAPPADEGEVRTRQIN